MKICPLRAELVHADWRIIRRKDMTKTNGRNFANDSKDMPRQETKIHFHFFAGRALSVHRFACGMDNDGIKGWFLEGERNFYFLRNVQARSVLRPVSYRRAPWVFFFWKSIVRGMKLTTYLYLLPTLSRNSLPCSQWPTIGSCTEPDVVSVLLRSVSWKSK
jgi:hypothetical protein